MSQPQKAEAASKRGAAKVRTARPEPEVRALLKLLNVGFPKSDSIGAARSGWRLLSVALGTHARVKRITQYEIDGPNGKIPLRVYLPSGADGLLPALIWFHGGGFVVGDLQSGDGTCRALARHSGAAVVAIDYRKCPEHDLYAGRADAIAAVDWIASNGAIIGVDSSRLAVGGDSAGGNIAAVVALDCARRGSPALRLQVLAYPATHLGAFYPSRQENGHGYFLTEEKISFFTRHLGNSDFGDPMLSPMLASELGGVAPTVLVTAGFDPLRDEGRLYGERLQMEGIAVESLHYPGQIHGFLSMDSVLAEARDALKRVGKLVASALAVEDEAAPQVPELSAAPIGNAGVIKRISTLNPAFGGLLRRQILTQYQFSVSALLFALESAGNVKDVLFGRSASDVDRQGQRAAKPR
jgi:acetyl esterase